MTPLAGLDRRLSRSRRCGSTDGSAIVVDHGNGLVNPSASDVPQLEFQASLKNDGLRFPRIFVSDQQMFSCSHLLLYELIKRDRTIHYIGPG